MIVICPVACLLARIEKMFASLDEGSYRSVKDPFWKGSTETTWNLEDHPRLISNLGNFRELTNHGYLSLANWDDPPRTSTCFKLICSRWKHLFVGGLESEEV